MKILTVTGTLINIALVSSTTITEERPRDIDTDLRTVVCVITLTFVDIWTKKKCDGQHVQPNVFFLCKELKFALLVSGYSSCWYLIIALMHVNFRLPATFVINGFPKQQSWKEYSEKISFALPNGCKHAISDKRGLVGNLNRMVT